MLSNSDYCVRKSHRCWLAIGRRIINFINPLGDEFFLGNIKNIFGFYIIS